MIAKTCPKCGATNSNETDWCTNCSYSLSGAQIVEKKGIIDESDDHINFEPELGRPPIVVLFVMVGLVAVGFVSLFLFGLFLYVGFLIEFSNVLFALIFALIGTDLFLITMLSFITLYGLKFAKKWAWKVVVLLLILEFLPFFDSYNIENFFQVIITLIVLVLFLLPDTKSYFETYQEKKDSKEKIIFSVVAVLTLFVLIGLFFLYYSSI